MNAEILDRYHITAKATEGSKPAPWGQNGAQHWRVTLSIRDGGGPRKLTVNFWQGAVHGLTPPTAEGVLECLCSEAEAGEEYGSDLTGFCRNFGYEGGFEASVDPKARKAWQGCVRFAPRLRRFLGASWDAVLYGEDEPAAEGEVEST